MKTNGMGDSVGDDTPFKPPEPGKLATTLSVLAAVAVLVAFYVGYGWWDARRAATEKAGGAQPFAVHLPSTSRVTSAPSQAPVVQDHGGASVERPSGSAPGLRKCVVQGRVLYTDNACPDGTQTATLERAPAVARPSSTTLYLCKTSSGDLFWTRQHCHQHGARVERTTTVPTDRSFDEQVALARERRAALAVPKPVPPTVVTGRSDAAQDRSMECKALNDRVAWLDAFARQPLSASQQDWVRSERKSARDRQFRQHC